MVIPWEGAAPIVIAADGVASRRLATTGFQGHLPPRRLKTCGYQNQTRIEIMPALATRAGGEVVDLL